MRCRAPSVAPKTRNSGRIDDLHDARATRPPRPTHSVTCSGGTPRSRSRLHLVGRPDRVPGAEHLRRDRVRRRRRARPPTASATSSSVQAVARTQPAAARHGLAHHQPGHRAHHEEDERVAGRERDREQRSRRQRRQPGRCRRPPRSRCTANGNGGGHVQEDRAAARAAPRRIEQRRRSRPRAGHGLPARAGRPSRSGPMLPSRAPRGARTRRRPRSRPPDARRPPTPTRTPGARCCAPA